MIAKTAAFPRLTILSLVAALILLVAGPSDARGAVDAFASPVQAGCYLARPDRCKIHVDPFTINLAVGKRLVSFQLMATRAGGSPQLIYDFRPDQSNPAPLTGSSYTPSLVAKDFAATCGQTYTVNLLGQDSGDATPFNLGITNSFTCPTSPHSIDLPVVDR